MHVGLVWLRFDFFFLLNQTKPNQSWLFFILTPNQIKPNQAIIEFFSRLTRIRDLVHFIGFLVTPPGITPTQW